MPPTRSAPALDIPATGRRHLPHLPVDEFGQWSENVARFFGTARYLVIQTAIVIVWIALNLIPAFVDIRWDSYPFILLNLAFSTQAAYAAPFILLAQNRQADRDRVQIERDRAQTAMQVANGEFISREIAGLRIMQGDTATRDYVRAEVARQLGELRDQIREDLRAELTRASVPVGDER